MNNKGNRFITSTALLVFVFVLWNTSLFAQTWDIQEIDTTGDVGKYTSIILDSNKKPIISYYDDDNDDLKVAVYDSASSTWNIITVDSVGDAGQYSSLAIDTLGDIVFGYIYTNLQSQSFLKCASAIEPLFSWDFEVIDSSGDAGWFPSMWFDTSGNLAISYYNYINEDLRLAVYDSASSTWNIITVDSVGDAGQYSSLAIDTLGDIVFGYIYTNLQSQSFLKCASAIEPLFSWDFEVIDSSGDAGWFPSMWFDTSGNLAISYYNFFDGYLMFTSKESSLWKTEIADSVGNVGAYNNLTFSEADENWHISYFDESGSTLKLADYLRHNVKIIEVIEPESEIIPIDVPVTPRVIIQNGSRNPETGSIFFTIGDIYYGETIFNLDTGQVDTAILPTWIPDEAAAYLYTCSLSVNSNEFAGDNIIDGRLFVTSENAPEIHSLVPNYGVSNTEANVTIYGTRFEQNVTACLMLSGESDILADTVEYINDTSLNVIFDLANAVIDQWDIKISYVTDESFTFYDGFNIVLYDGDILPFCSTVVFIVHDGSTIEIGGAVIPKADEDLFMVLKKTNLSWHDTWVGDIQLLDIAGNEIVSATGGNDVAFQIGPPYSGLIRLVIHAYDPGSGEVTFCDQLPQLTLGQWYVGEILRPFGMDWVQFDVPEGVTTLYIQSEGFGDNSYFDVFYNHINFPTLLWHFDNDGQGYHIEGQIPNPPAGRYYIRYLDSHNIGGDPPSQVREYMIYVGADMVPPDTGLPPTITGLSTYIGGQGPVTVIVSGQGLDSGSTVSLIRDGYTDIFAGSVFGNSIGVELAAHFDLSSAETGEWQLVVTNPNSEADTASDAFSVVEGGEYEIQVNLLGRELIRAGRPQTLVLRCTNVGSVDIPYLYLDISTPGVTDVELSYPDISHLPLEGLDIDTLPASIVIDNTTYAPLLLIDLAAGLSAECLMRVYSENTGDFSIKIEARATDLDDFLEIEKATTEAMRQSVLSDSNAPMGWLIPAQDSTVWWDSYCQALDSIGVLGWLSEKHRLHSRSWLDVTDHPIFQAGAKLAVAGLKFIWDHSHGTPSWKSATGYVAAKINWYLVWWEFLCEKYPLGCANIMGWFGRESSVDPEAKYGPSGFDIATTPQDSLSRFVAQSKSSYSYRIDFWNHEDAGADAQIVMIRDTLDTDFDLSTFRFDEFGFLKWSVPLESFQYFDVDIDLRPDKDLVVNVEGILDPDHRAVEWTFTSMVPESDTLPDLIGFLPPMSDSGYEIGWVDFTIEPLPGLPPGTQLTNQCYSNFDWQPPCDTCPLWTPAPKNRPWVNTIDADPPVSEVLGLPTTMDSLYFTVNWVGSDTLGSGIKSYSIYYDIDTSGVYELWLEDTNITSAEFTETEDGKTYRFYSIATDNVGYVEPAPDSFDTRTTISFPFTCGDVNCDDAVNIFDVTNLISFLYMEGPEPCHMSLANVNHRENGVNIFDITYLIASLYLEGPPPDCIGSGKEFASTKRNVTSDSASIDCSINEGNSTIIINSPSEILGLEMTLKSKDGGTVFLESVIDGVKLYSSQDGDIITLGMVDAEGQKFIPKSKTEIIKVDGKVEILSILAANKSSQSIPFKFNNIILPRVFSLDQNYPNPFNPTTTIKFALPKSSNVNLEIYNILGRRVTTLINEQLDAGYHTVKWNSTDSEGRDVATGVYFYRLKAGDFVKSKKMLLLK